jgi:glycosyltransferase involved in cell wall biosynthesis
MSEVAITPYPLSQEFRSRFEESVSAHPRYLSLAELRRLPLSRLLRELRSLDSERLFLPLEDQSSRVLLPVLHGIAALTRTKRIEVVFPDLSRAALPRWRAALALSDLVGASLAGQVALRRCRRELRELSRSPRIAVGPLEPGPLLYLKSTLALGVQAGGSVGHTAGVVNAMLACGRGVDFVSAETPILLSQGVGLRAVAPPRIYGLPPEVNLYRFQHRFAQEAGALCDERDYAFLYQRLTLGSYAGVAVSRAAGLPLVLEYNGPEAWAAMHWGTPLRYAQLAEHAETVSLAHAHLIVVVSEVLRDQLVERGVEPERIVFHPNGIDPELFDPERYDEAERRGLRERYGIPPDAVVATFLGTFGDWHGADVLASAIRELADGDADWLLRHKVHFLLVGDGLKMPLVRETLSSEACIPFYTLTGLVRQEDAPLHLAASDLFLSPHVPNPDGTPFFGSPTKLFEYMAMGRGIVASELNQIGEVLAGSPRVSNGDLERLERVPGPEQCAVLTAPGDVAELVRAIRFMVEHPKWREAAGGHARQRALGRLTWRHHVDHVLEALGEVLA